MCKPTDAITYLYQIMGLVLKSVDLLESVVKVCKSLSASRELQSKLTFIAVLSDLNQNLFNNNSLKFWNVFSTQHYTVTSDYL